MVQVKQVEVQMELCNTMSYNFKVVEIHGYKVKKQKISTTNNSDRYSRALPYFMSHLQVLLLCLMNALLIFFTFNQ